jgi:hypothetical protein
MGRLDEAGRQIAGLLTYNPGPGIYSRLERAIEAMPESVRVQELPGLLKRYKDGVPGWELKATDLDSVIAGRDTVPRAELLARVQERSPVYTHKEVVLADELPTVTLIDEDVLRRSKGGITQSETITLPQYQEEASPLGRGIGHGDPKYQAFGQGGTGYTELLLAQPGARAGEYGNHWRNAATQYVDAAEDAVAHARFDTHGDALRINELQSDLGIHNRKARELPESYEPPGAFDRVARGRELPFPLEDTWADLLIKRLALEAARKGHRAIEVASPRAIADKVGGNIENYEHFYGKVVPGALERLGRKMGGLVDDVPAQQSRNRFVPSEEDLLRVRSESRDMIRDEVFAQQGDPFVGSPFWKLYDELQQAGHSSDTAARAIDMFGGYVLPSPPRGQSEIAADMYKHFVDLGYTPQQSQRVVGRALLEAPQEMRQKIRYTAAIEADQNARPEKVRATPGRRYLMSDEMRRRLIEGGVGASLLAPLLMQDGE